MPFLAKLDLDAERDVRRARRFLAHRLDTLLVGRDRRFDIIVHNISETGFLAELTSELQVGDEVGLQLARLGFVPARVVWKRGQGHGCEFLAPVPVEVIEETIAASVRFGDEAANREEAERLAKLEERTGLRRRERRERLGAIILLVCMLLAVAVLAAALIRILA